jgi:hypothetical protein
MMVERRWDQEGISRVATSQQTWMIHSRCKTEVTVALLASMNRLKVRATYQVVEGRGTNSWTVESLLKELASQEKGRLK